MVYRLHDQPLSSQGDTAVSEISRVAFRYSKVVDREMKIRRQCNISFESKSTFTSVCDFYEEVRAGEMFLGRPCRSDA